jgi:hypothetical protein
METRPIDEILVDITSAYTYLLIIGDLYNQDPITETDLLLIAQYKNDLNLILLKPDVDETLTVEQKLELNKYN